MSLNKYLTFLKNLPCIKTLEAGNETLVVALDISKDFDMVWQKNADPQMPSTPTQSI